MCNTLSQMVFEWVGGWIWLYSLGIGVLWFVEGDVVPLG